MQLLQCPSTRHSTNGITILASFLDPHQLMLNFVSLLDIQLLGYPSLPTTCLNICKTIQGRGR